MYKYEGSWKQSTVYVYANNGGNPGTLGTSATFTPSSNGWYTVNFSTQPSYTGDFFIVVALGSSGAGYMETALGLDGGLNAGARMIAYDYGMWKNPTETMPDYYASDFMIRAMVSYVGAEESELLPVTTQLNSVTPNPITTKTTISYMLAENSKVNVTIYDISGKLVKTLSNEAQSSGMKTLDWNVKDNNGNKVSSGMYFCKLNVNGKAISTKSLIVL
ncbi:MAG: T9SS type A sorting domain-containing protein [bacterium]|nr:T9SS type A sorting domain-containing protein [bacterium]